jgi:dipeptidase E
VYGVSAGAIVLGRDIESCIHYDENAVGIEDTAGLDLLGGHCVWCHFEPHHEERITQYIARSGHPFLGCPEGSAIRIDGARTIDIGTVPALHWNTRGQCTALGRDDATG